MSYSAPRAVPPPALFVAFLLAIVPTVVHGQERNASLEVSVHDAETELPLAGAVVLIEGFGFQGITDRDGVLVLPRLRAGSHTVGIRYLGYAPLEEVIRLEAGHVRRMRMDLEVSPIPLAAVEVRARESILVSRGFYERSRGSGTFVTRERIERMRPRYLSDLLRQVAGIHVGGDNPGGYPAASIRGQQRMMGPCPIQYYVDGTFTAFFNIDEIRPEDVEGIEIYRGAASIPPVFNRGSAMCGVIVVWTRM